MFLSLLLLLLQGPMDISARSGWKLRLNGKCHQSVFEPYRPLNQLLQIRAVGLRVIYLVVVTDSKLRIKKKEIKEYQTSVTDHETFIYDFKN